jgi:hypothetical protein
MNDGINSLVNKNGFSSCPSWLISNFFISEVSILNVGPLHEWTFVVIDWSNWLVMTHFITC